jgi:hypothetical protein
MRRGFWLFSFVSSVAACALFGTVVVRDPAARPVDPGIVALENVEHEVFEGPDPQANEFLIRKTDVVPLLTFVSDTIVSRDRMALAGAVISIIMLAMSVVGVVQSRVKS